MGMCQAVRPPFALAPRRPDTAQLPVCPRGVAPKVRQVPRLVRVAGNEARRGGCRAASRLAVVLALHGQRVGLGADVELLRRRRLVLLLAGPHLKAGLLQSAAVREGERPRLLRLELVHLVEDHGGLLLRHAAREEGHGRNGRRHRALQALHRHLRDLRRRGLLGRRRRLAVAHHVRLEERALEQHVVVAELLVARRDHLLGDDLRRLDRVVAVHEHLRLDDRHEAVRLADRRVPRKRLGVLLDGDW
mmetsp:Transcript_25209/g.65125  ORF Transcript_25209/g.65125 Transcript_25209/m.65125 type:complete len:247 (+) Transcript_25209:255-995(+)